MPQELKECMRIILTAGDNIVSRNYFIPKQPLFTRLNVNYDNENTFMNDK